MPGGVARCTLLAALQSRVAGSVTQSGCLRRQKGRAFDWCAQTPSSRSRVVADKKRAQVQEVHVLFKMSEVARSLFGEDYQPNAQRVIRLNANNGMQVSEDVQCMMVQFVRTEAEPEQFKPKMEGS
jgi:hypothetical protein